MPKTVKLKNPNTAFFASNGQVVRGTHIVRFNDPVPADLHSRIGSGFLIETDEEPTPIKPTPSPAPAALGARMAGAASQPNVDDLLARLTKVEAQIEKGGGSSASGKELKELRNQIETLAGDVATVKETVQAASGASTDTGGGESDPKTPNK